jgi:lipoprotein
VKRLKNKIKCIMILAVVIGLSISCNKVNVVKQNADKEELYNSYIRYENLSNNATSGYNIVGKKFSLINSTMNLDIDYPCVLGMEDVEKQEQINKLIFLISTGTYYDIFVHNGLEVSSNYSIIYSDESYLSIKYDGFVVVREANRPHYMCFCLNVDLKTGEVIKLEDLVDIEKLKDKFVKDNFTVVKGLDENIPVDEKGWKDLFNKYLKYPFLDEDDLHNYDFYFTNNKIGLIISCNTDAGGRYIILESNDNLSLADIKR